MYSDWVEAAPSRGWRFKNPAAHGLKLLEEAVELCLALGATEDNVMATVSREFAEQAAKGNVGGAFDAADAWEEVADVQVCLELVALGLRVDIAEAVAEKTVVLEGRVWTPDANGILRRQK